uniref:LPXTG cell wall anchor domain-containing protein n=1 Tax=Enterococcus faecalis TaxID=1351 RepID=UPI0034D0043A
LYGGNKKVYKTKNLPNTGEKKQGLLPILLGELLLIGSLLYFSLVNRTSKNKKTDLK